MIEKKEGKKKKKTVMLNGPIPIPKCVYFKNQDQKKTF